MSDPGDWQSYFFSDTREGLLLKFRCWIPDVRYPGWLTRGEIGIKKETSYTRKSQKINDIH